jgi:hypothetical protein
MISSKRLPSTNWSRVLRCVAEPADVIRIGFFSAIDPFAPVGVSIGARESWFFVAFMSSCVFIRTISQWGGLVPSEGGLGTVAGVLRWLPRPPRVDRSQVDPGRARRLAAGEICLMLTSNCVFGRDLLLGNLEFERSREIVSKHGMMAAHRADNSFWFVIPCSLLSQNRDRRIRRTPRTAKGENTQRLLSAVEPTATVRFERRTRKLHNLP